MSSSLPFESPPELTENPRTWRFTWECQSHVPSVKLYIFKPKFSPSTSSKNLKVDLIVEQSLLIVSFIHVEAKMETSLRVPLPSKALIDLEAPVHFKALADHIEVKLVLLLPIDHPLISEIDSMSDECRPLSPDSDLKKLSALGEVYFYCRSCSTKLTKPLRIFEEVPSVNWQDVADNWFGDCCCSFGGISEKLVTKYVKSYECSKGVCFLDTTSVILSTDDLVECDFSTFNGIVTGLQKLNFGDEIKQGQQSHVEENSTSGRHEGTQISNDSHSSCCLPPSSSETEENVEKRLLLPRDMKHEHLLAAHQKVLRNGFLESGFMARSCSLTKDVRWVEFTCHTCSSLVGAYPCFDEHVPLDGGVRLFKCQVSTSLPSLGSNDLFRCYSLDRMFAHRLVESAKEELSFRTIIRDLETGNPMLQIVLLNPNSWCYSGSCLPSNSKSSSARIDMYPSVNVLFSSSCKDKEVISREIEEWIAKKEVEEIYMMPCLIRKLVTCLECAHTTYHPPLQKTMQGGFLLSFLRR